MAQVVGSQLLCCWAVPCRNGGDCSTQVKILVILIQGSFSICVSHSLMPQQLYVLGMDFRLSVFSSSKVE